jgi:hypothetical protein
MGKDIENEVPASPARKPTPKKIFSLNDFKKRTGGEDVSDKSLRWLVGSSALQTSTGLPGFPIGYVSLSRGFTNTGKSTAICEGIVSAQKMGVLPIIIDTENNIGRERLRKMGFDWEGGFYYEVDNDYLLRNFGKKQDSKRKEAAIEDMAEAIHYFLDEQEADRLPYELLFAIDSLGSLDCIKTINALEKNTNDNNMWNAGAFEKSFKYLLNNTIPSSRKENRKYTNTVIGVQKIWIDNLGQGVVKHKGGETFYYGSRLIYHFGGIAAHGTKIIDATSKTRKVSYGIQTKVNVAKNQIDGPLGGISFEGDIISTPHGFILPEGIEEYKKEHLLFFRNALGSTDIEASDIVDTYREVQEGESFELEG